MDGRHLQFIDIRAIVMFCIRDSGLQHFLDDPCRLFVAKVEQIHGPLHWQAANLVRDESQLLRRDPCVAVVRCRGHCRYSVFAFLSAEWLRNVRVAANSPSLWPTMFSEMYTGICCLPLWTWMVKPTMSGRTTERRDQVLMGRLSFAARALSI